MGAVVSLRDACSDVRNAFSCGGRRRSDMTDTVDQATGSRMMSRIGAKDTKPELVLRRALHARGLRYRLHARKLAGTPDLAFPRFRAVCFVHGCFWHRHVDCRRTSEPATRQEFWRAKFKANVERDRSTRQALLEGGWRVATIWECALGGDLTERTAEAVEQWLRGTEAAFETTLDGSDQFR